ncbi:carboxypeptidase-like regulatory domain-containing protein [Marinilabilia sp.]|uniref:carboxypeptidase-like regulatory domain-containing protein n=1 Tax=Marinilabilia sp. TaxID=2021252 RepID=UPI0025C3B5D0|nr:carboxypeptidase-like regulatory domain-containing protein [Marinilabilia sp.]
MPGMIFFQKYTKRIKANSILLKYLVLVFVCLLLSFPTLGQENILDRKYSFGYDSISISAFFDSLSVRYDIAFSYDASLVRGDSIFNARADSVFLDKWLKKKLKQEDLEIHQMDRQIIISSEPARVTVKSIHIEGVVVDSVSGEPMDMVNIGILGKSLGTASNRQGKFGFYLPAEYVGEKLVFSSLGYRRDSLIIPASDTTIVVALGETSVELPEVLVKLVEPDMIMNEVVRRKKNNYANDPLILTAFFRETIQQDEKYVDVSEAVVEIFKPPYHQEYALERVRFVKGRKGEFSGDMEMIDFKLQGGPFLFSRVDIVRQGGFLPDATGNSVYKYFFKRMDYDHGRRVFVVGFEPHNDSGELLYEGEIVVEEKSFAIVGATFEMTNKTIRKSREYLIRRDSRRFRTKPSFARYHIDYRPLKDKWVLNSVRGEVNMKVIDRKENLRTVFNTVSELLVTDLRPGERKEFRWNESFRADYILSDQIESYDKDFWSRYNIISPDESVEKIFEKEE